MLWLDAIAEQKIREAVERGEFTDLPGEGRPLDLTADPLVPEDLRVAYRILKNAGFLPPQLEAQKEIRDLEQLIRGLEVGPERSGPTSIPRITCSRSRISFCASSWGGRTPAFLRMR